VANNEITGLSAANGVVAENIDRLHAHRASRVRVHHGNTESVLDCSAEVAGGKDCVITVLVRRDSRYETAGMRLGGPREALKLASSGEVSRSQL
jgi:hypothetical protein